MINRKIFGVLNDFYKHQKQALLLTGARQIGKTFSIRHFATTHFKHFVEFNLVDNRAAREAFAEPLSAEELLLRITALSKNPLVEGETLIFFDEVQECPELVTAIKFLVEDGRYRYIMSGSLLGVELRDLRSVPVGYLQVTEMYPLDFEEFAWACGVAPTLFDTLRANYISLMPVDAVVHTKMLQLFRLYLAIGGMPAVVMEYLSSNNLRLVSDEQKRILLTYKKDISKYDPQEKLYLNEIFDLIPSELNAKNKRFILKRMNENVKFSRCENSFLWMRDVGVALPTYAVEAPIAPLLLSKARNLFKLFLADVGLLTCQYGTDVQLGIIMANTNLNNGALYENAVAQELRAHGFPLFYFNSKRQGEIDFIVEKDGGVLPIEVKSGKDYKRHAAITNVLANPQYAIPRGVVLCNNNITRNGNIVYLPIYMVALIQPQPMHDTIVPIPK